MQTDTSILTKSSVGNVTPIGNILLNTKYLRNWNMLTKFYLVSATWIYLFIKMPTKETALYCWEKSPSKQITASFLPQITSLGKFFPYTTFWFWSENTGCVNQIAEYNWGKNLRSAKIRAVTLFWYIWLHFSHFTCRLDDFFGRSSHYSWNHNIFHTKNQTKLEA